MKIETKMGQPTKFLITNQRPFFMVDDRKSVVVVALDVARKASLNV